MTLTATLRKNGKRVTAITLKADRRRVTNEFSARAWLQALHINDGDILTVILADETHTLAEMQLEKHTEKGRTVYRSATDTGALYSWANLTAGYGETWGLTAACMIRKKVNDVIIQAGEIFDIGDGI